MSVMLKGTPVSPGLAMGAVYRIEAVDFKKINKKGKGAKKELARFEAAREKAVAALGRLEEQARASLGEEKAAIFAAHAMMIEDPALLSDVTSAVEKGACAEDALVDAILYQKAQFDVLEDEYFKERAADVLDIGMRLYRKLIDAPELASVPPGCVLTTELVAPSDAVLLKAMGVAAVLTEQGGATSHYAILLSTSELPGISGLSADGLSKLKQGAFVLCDGNTGEIIIEPSKAQQKDFAKRIKELEDTKRELVKLKDKKAVTLDGTEVDVWANIASSKDAQKVLEKGARGVGLFRTEFLFMEETSAPNEDKQFAAYREILEAMKPYPVVIRTLDAGGDKDVPYLKDIIGEEANPFLGLRAIRLCLKHEGLLKTQLKALARASAHGNLMIMLPMVSSCWEIREARRLLDEAAAEIRTAGQPVADKIPLGIMIEIPAAAVTAGALAKEADFFSVGTNDLIQYTLAADRQNPKLADWYEPFHPAIISLLKMTSDAAKSAKIHLSMCGEMCSNPLAIPLLVAMGFDHISMSAVKIPRAKKTIMELNAAACRSLLDEITQLESAAEIKKRLEEFSNF